MNIAKCIINSCAPTRRDQNWGDAPFAEHLAAGLRKAGCDARVAYADEWRDTRALACAAVVHIRGLERYTPNPEHYNILWIISHPELVTEEELRSFDLVLCASRPFARSVESRFRIPCAFLPQATTGEFLDYRRGGVQDIDVLFVGNNYCAREGRRRQIVEDFLQTGVSCTFKVVGICWDGFAPPEALLAEYVPHGALPELYTRAKISLNDHHPTMAADGFINNRTYDLMALGAAQISTPVEGLDELGVASYGSVEELRDTVSALLADAGLREAGAARARELARAHTFERAAADILRRAEAGILARCRVPALPEPL